MTLLLLGLLVLIYAYLAVRITGAIKQTFNIERGLIKFLTIFIPLYFISYPIIGLVGYLFGVQGIISQFRFGGKIFDALFTYPFWFGLVFAVQTFLLFLAVDITKFILSFVKVYSLQTRLAFVYPRLILILAFASALYSAVKIYIDTNSIKVNAIDLKVKNLPSTLKGFKIAHISDIQADNRTGEEKLAKYVDLLNSLQPDIVIFTGDAVTYGTEHIPIAVKMLSKVKSKFGLYSCVGDHDYWAGLKNINDEMNKYGLRLYSNENAILKIDGAKIGLTFVTNIYSVRPEIETLNKLASENETDLKIFVTHQPSESLVNFAHKNGYKIFLAGHTHGGQVVFSFFGFKFIPSRVETKYVSGYYRLDSMLVNVNNGLGFTLAPIRFNAPAEITLIKLLPEG